MFRNIFYSKYRMSVQRPYPTSPMCRGTRQKEKSLLDAG